MAGETVKNFALQCPVELPSDQRIVMAHGAGGRLTQRLIERVFLPAFANAPLEERHDGALIQPNGARLAFTTDSYVVKPLIFPGGNIGDLAVNGTVNDLAMCGARPLYLSCGFILEEGLPMATLETVVASMRAAALTAGVQIVTGDTKVVDRGKGDGIYINTSGVGVVEGPFTSPARVEPGDAILLSGDIASHGVAILSVRDGLEFEAPIVSDTRELWSLVDALFRAGIDVHCLRDCTRGGVSSALNEVAQARSLMHQIEESAIPVHDAVKGACELLGLDPLYVANEGRFVAWIPAAQAAEALRVLPEGAASIGVVLDKTDPLVVMRSRIGGSRVVDMLSGEQLPRIC
ncbi:MAG: hydrogenase expression/formation protein HypE [Acidobacteria bacterium]|nr:hydrogenase expression/formation protein HypE [Acidobacteriota bacterium]